MCCDFGPALPAGLPAISCLSGGGGIPQQLWVCRASAKVWNFLQSTKTYRKIGKGRMLAQGDLLLYSETWWIKKLWLKKNQFLKELFLCEFEKYVKNKVSIKWACFTRGFPSNNIFDWIIQEGNQNENFFNNCLSLGLVIFPKKGEESWTWGHVVWSVSQGAVLSG